MKFYWYWTRALTKRSKRWQNLSRKELLRELQNKNYDNTSTVRYIQISVPFSPLRSRPERDDFLIKLYDDDKKVLKIYFQPHKLFEKVFCVRSENENGLLMEVILMHWAAFISHIMENEYRKGEQGVFRSIPNCIYVVEVIWSGQRREEEKEKIWAWKNRKIIESKFVLGND